MYSLMKFFGNPHKKFKSFHIAGTKGKGSTAVFLEFFLRMRGFKTGLFLSPQLIDERDRYLIFGELPSWRYLLETLDKVLHAAKELRIPSTVFEIFTASAFIMFAEKKIEYAVIETGLGGRLDTTNILKPFACLITPIDFDHMDKLGSTLTAIAGGESRNYQRQSARVFGETKASGSRCPCGKSSFKTNAHNLCFSAQNIRIAGVPISKLRLG